jgi:hypothetical protein
MAGDRRSGQRLRSQRASEEEAKERRALVCPFTMIGLGEGPLAVRADGKPRKAALCIAGTCAVWDASASRCALLSIASHLDAVAQERRGIA